LLLGTLCPNTQYGETTDFRDWAKNPVTRQF